MTPKVHGDIRHLEKDKHQVTVAGMVHGDIRHLEKTAYISH